MLSARTAHFTALGVACEDCCAAIRGVTAVTILFQTSQPVNHSSWIAPASLLSPFA